MNTSGNGNGTRPPNWQRSIIFGALLGTLHAFILDVSTHDGFALISFMAFNRNPYHFGFLLTFIIDLVIVTTVSTCVWWLPAIMQFRDEIVVSEMEAYDPEDYEKELKARKLYAFILFVIFATLMTIFYLLGDSFMAIMLY